MKIRYRHWPLMAAMLMVAGMVLAFIIPTTRAGLRAMLPPQWVVSLNSWRYGYSVDHKIRISMHDGAQLAVSLYLPDGAASAGKLPTVLVRLPYDRLRYAAGLEAAQLFVRNGYAVVLQDLRGKFASQGKFLPYESATQDGASTLDWITRQPWSNGKVGTFGCSALGETQYSLARTNHFAHTAMIASGAGGGMGAAAGRHAYFGVFEGGIFQLASGFGWFYEHGAHDPNSPRAGSIDTAAAIRQLPLKDLVKKLTSVPNAYSDYVTTPLADKRWRKLDFVEQEDVLKVPTLAINTWGDQTVGDALALSEFMRNKMPPEAAQNQHMIIASGNHCGHEQADTSQFGELTTEHASLPFEALYLDWFDRWLRGNGAGASAGAGAGAGAGARAGAGEGEVAGKALVGAASLKKLPAYLFYVVGENRWLSSAQWPPINAVNQRWDLVSEGSANSRSGNGVLTSERNKFNSGAIYDEFRSDPFDPVPSVGGPTCCTGNPADRSGPAEQARVEKRDDVLVYTSSVLLAPMRIAGSLKAHLVVSSSALDTDIVARLVDVWPDGRATSIQEGALRLRYRDGLDQPKLLEPNKPVEVTIDMRAIAYYLPKGHRIRLHIAGSCFPRLERNLNTGGNNFDETAGVVAINKLFHSDGARSYLELPVLAITENADGVVK